eukprot:2269444-Pleurochrysis_carterae.AAC.1
MSVEGRRTHEGNACGSERAGERTASLAEQAYRVTLRPLKTKLQSSSGHSARELLRLMPPLLRTQQLTRQRH